MKRKLFKLAIFIQETGINRVIVPYLFFFTKFVLRRWRPHVILVTGSSGKTILLEILKHQFKDRAYHSHLANSEIGLALNVVRMKGILTARDRWLWPAMLLWPPIKSLYVRHQAEYYLAEFDAYASHINYPRLIRWLQPERVILMNISPTHSANFEAEARRKKQPVLELITTAFGILAKGASEKIYALEKSKTVTRALRDSKTPIDWLKPKLVNYQVSAEETKFQFESGTFRFRGFQPPVIAKQLQATLSLCQDLGVEIDYDLRKAVLSKGRTTTLAGIRKTALIDSTYNAQLDAFVSLFDMFKKMPKKTRIWLVVGHIKEHGGLAAEIHNSLSREIIKLGPEKVVLVGRTVHRHCFDRLEKSGLDVYSSFKLKETLDYLETNLKGEEVVLFKGAGYLDYLIVNLLEDEKDAGLTNQRYKLAGRKLRKFL